jgi:type VI secretion system protein ImpF
VRRDLEALLNSRRPYHLWSPDLDELDRSLSGYGLPDFTGADLASDEAREDFCRTIETTIRRFEPRFKSVSVGLVENSDPNDRTLRFRIDALLRVDPAPEPVVFNSVLEPVTSNVKIGSADDV